MADILPFKRPTAAAKHKGKSLCRDGFHRWQIDGTKQFDVKQGRLVTVYRCERCNATKTEGR